MAKDLKKIIRQFVEEVIEIAKEDGNLNQPSEKRSDIREKASETLENFNGQATTFSAYVENLDLIVSPVSSENLAYKLFLPKNIEPSDVDVKIDQTASKFDISFLVSKQNIYGRVELEIPSKFSVYESIKTTNGDIQIQNVSVKELFAESRNGNINICKTKFDKAKICCDNGDIDIHLDDEDYQISAHSRNGDVDNDRKNVKNASKSLSCDSKNGDISIL